MGANASITNLQRTRQKMRDTIRRYESLFGTLSVDQVRAIVEIIQLADNITEWEDALDMKISNEDAENWASTIIRDTFASPVILEKVADVLDESRSNVVRVAFG